ncbi:hypothetical protein DICVIV_13952 [Dictyocaulus viviparus]|uniref:Uncharacterized protein n=1 Tax=Dictyocaulus viviparus TaxID=29172 RepID=A0A0D8X6E9_DICVI|nr:hypothetical protein DICVIV_13952 [Dictyocaulus viviparus]
MNFSGVVVALFFIVIAQGYVISPDSRIRSRRGIFEDETTKTLEIKIGGKSYSTEIPGDLEYDIYYESYTENDEDVELITARLNDEIELYKTVGGRTTVTDDKGNVKPDGGRFHVTS